MDQNTYDRIKAAVVAETSTGNRLVRKLFGIVNSKVRYERPQTACGSCAIGCLLIHECVISTDSMIEDAARALGASGAAVLSFINGFDGHREESARQFFSNAFRQDPFDAAWFEAGRRMAAEFGLGDGSF